MSIIGKLGFLVALMTMGVAAIYAIKPTERRLSVMRPLSTASVFAALCSFSAGGMGVLMGIASTTPGKIGWHDVAAGAAESLLPLLTGFGCLAIAWVLVALGIRRTS